MPTPRRPLGVIDGNIKKRKELTPYKRGQIVGARKTGAQIAAIINELDVTESTAKYTLRHASQRTEGASKPRAGAPKRYTERDEQNILRFVRKPPKTKYAEIKRHCGLAISLSTIKRVLRANNILSWRAKQRPALHPKWHV